MAKLHTPRDAAEVLGISYASLKQWIYHGKLKSVQTAGGHHRIPESEIDRLLPPSWRRFAARTHYSGVRVFELEAHSASQDSLPVAIATEDDDYPRASIPVSDPVLELLIRFFC